MLRRVLKLGVKTGVAAGAATVGYAQYKGLDVSNLEEMSKLFSEIGSTTKDISDELEKRSDECNRSKGKDTYQEVLNDMQY